MVISAGGNGEGLLAGPDVPRQKPPNAMGGSACNQRIDTGDRVPPFFTLPLAATGQVT